MHPMDRLRSLTAGVGAVAVAATLAATPAAADSFRMSIGAGHPAAPAIWVLSIRDFFQAEVKKRVEAQTDHTIEWTEAYGGSVCKPGECLAAIQDGLLDIGDVHIPFSPRELLAHNFTYFVPFGTPDARVAAREARVVWDENEGLKDILKDRYNQIFLGIGAVNNYGLNTNFEWKTVDDLKGRRIAAAGPNIPWVSAVGVTPVQSNLNEAYTSLQTGVYEGWVMLIDGVVGFKLHEVSKYFVQTDFGAIANPLITINRDTWDRLPPEIQEIMSQVGLEYTDVMSQWTHEKSERSFDLMRSEGGIVRQLDWDEKVAWANALPNIPKERMQEIAAAGQPPEVIPAYIERLKAAGHEFPRDWSKELD